MVEKDPNITDEIHAGLRALAMQAFPKKCTSCGQVYNTMEDFLSQTDSVKDTSSLKQGHDDNEKVLLELYRNCKCGSTLMEYCGDRRDMSEAGIKMRKTFDDQIKLLTKAGMEPNLAQSELRKIARGQKSDIIKEFIGNLKKQKS